MRILCIGDIVGKPGRQAIFDFLPKIKEELAIDFVVANAENSAGGSGITKNMADYLTRAGVNAITLGDHIWDQRCFEREIGTIENLCKPSNLPPENPGKNYVFAECKGLKIAVFSLLGQTLMKIKADCPFRAANKAMEELANEADIIILDFHSETSSEKISMGNLLDGRATIVYGTHTHVPTADARILKKGTAYISDLGMTGPWDGCLGRDKDAVLQRFLDGRPRAFAVAENDVHICGCIVEIDESTKKPTSIKSFIFPDWNEPLPLTPQQEKELQKKAELQEQESKSEEAKSDTCE